MNKKICCIKGHQNISGKKMEFVKERLREEIRQAIKDGYTWFIIGAYKMVDMLSAQLLVEAKKEHPGLFLEAVFPYRIRFESVNPIFYNYLDHCGSVHLHQEEYSYNGARNCNRYMVARSSRVIVVYDGREKGSTLFTMRCASIMQREIREIRI